MTCRICISLVASLAMTDLLTGSIVAPLHAAEYLNPRLWTCMVEMIRRYVLAASMTASALFIGFISYDTSLHLKKLQDYNMEDSVFYTLLIVSWLISLILPFFKVSGTELVDLSTIVIIGVLVLIVIVISYAGLMIALSDNSREETQGDRNVRLSVEKAKHGGITVLILITLYMLMVVPVIAYHWLNTAKSLDKYTLPKAYDIIMLLAVTNSSVNPLIYCYRIPAIRKHTFQLFAELFNKKASLDVENPEQSTIEQSM